MEIASRETVENLFTNEMAENSLEVISNCCICGIKIKVIIDRTSDGFGLLGGMLYESDHNGLAVKCPNCVGIVLGSVSTV